MTEPQPRRRWWTRKRWAAALAIWLVLPAGYVATVGTAWYCDARGWTPNELSWALTKPIDPLVEATGLERAWVSYNLYWTRLGWKHAGWSD